MFQAIWIVASLIAIAALGWSLWRRLGSDRMQSYNDARRASCRLVGRGELLEGGQQIPVAIALSGSTLFYENADLNATLELDQLQEIEYDSESMTGHSLDGRKIMRLRSMSRVLEFALDSAVIPQWQALLPAVREAR